MDAFICCWSTQVVTWADARRYSDPLFGAGGASYNVSRTSGKENLASYLKKKIRRFGNVLQVTGQKMLQCIRNIWQVTWRKYCKVAGTSCMLLNKRCYNALQCIKNIWQFTPRKYYNIAGTSCMLLEKVVPMYQVRLANYLKKLLPRTRNVLHFFMKKMLQRIRNVLQVTCRRDYNVTGTSCKLLEEHLTQRKCYNVSGTSCKLLE